RGALPSGPGQPTAGMGLRPRGSGLLLARADSHPRVGDRADSGAVWSRRGASREKGCLPCCEKPGDPLKPWREHLMTRALNVSGGPTAVAAGLYGGDVALTYARFGHVSGQGARNPLLD